MNDTFASWRSPDRESVLRAVYLTTYAPDRSEGKVGGRGGGGLSVTFATALAASQVFERLLQTTQRATFGCVRNGRMPAAAALTISEENPRMLHVESVGKTTILALNAATEALFGERLPRRLLHRLKIADGPEVTR